MDAEGTVYLAGVTGGDLGGNVSEGDDDMFVAAFDTDGNELWIQQVGSDGTDVARAIAVGPEGQVYVSGFAYGQIGEEFFGGADAYLARLCSP